MPIVGSEQPPTTATNLASSSLSISSTRENDDDDDEEEVNSSNDNKVEASTIATTATPVKEPEAVSSSQQQEQQDNNNTNNNTVADNNKKSTTKTTNTSLSSVTTIEQLQQKFITNQQQRQQRRSYSTTTSIQQDPIIAPGFGTKRDVQRLARELNLAVAASTASTSTGSTTTTGTTTNVPIFTVANIQYLMERRGRGIPKQPKDDTAKASSSSAATTTINAWEDFMKEAGVVTTTSNNKGMTTTGTTAVEETNIITGKRGRSSAVPNDGATTTSTTTGSTTTTSNANSKKRVYDLESLQLPSITPAAKASKKVKTTTAASSTSVCGGRLLQTGTLDVSMIGRTNNTAANKKTIDFNDAHTLCVPTQILSTSIKIRKVVTAGHACHNIAISVDGIAYGWGRNEQYQLGSFHNTASHVKNLYQPTPLVLSTDNDSIVEPVLDAAVGKGHTVLLFANGEIKSCGWNKSGQCAVNNSGLEIVSNFRSCTFTGIADTPTITQVACGEDFTVVLDTDGYMYSAGSSEYGQLGNGETGQYFITASKLVFANSTTLVRRSTYCWAGANEKIYGNSDSNTKVVPLNEDIRIQQIACGKHHSIALEANAVDGQQHPLRVFTWGCGDYGVLGHGIQADEYYPRMVGSLSNLRLQTTAVSPTGSQVRIAAGQHCSLLQTSNGHVYYWGKHRMVGEATMRPTLVDALANNGHVVTQIGAGGQTVVCCTQHKQTVAWGHGTCGELGFGMEKKSSSKPSFVEGLEGCYVLSVACGYGTTLFVVRDNDEDDKKALEHVPVLDPDVPNTLEEVNEQDDGEGDDAAPTKAGRKSKSKK